MSNWGFYGRAEELETLRQILERHRWFFAKVTGRRRIGKTTLIQRALQSAGAEKVLYMQVPDSAPAGVLSSMVDAMETFHIPATIARPKTLADLAKLIGVLARDGYVVALDEFQYFNREKLREFCSLLQNEVDVLSASASSVPGGLMVLGSIHTEVSAILEDRAAPLYNRATDEISLSHLDIESLVELLEIHADASPERLLFLWNLFEGVPKFYRDCFEQGVLAAGRRTLIERTFFLGSSPLRAEADNWFLKELHGRYDAVLKYIAKHQGSMHGELLENVRSLSAETDEQVSGYLKILVERYQLLEKKLPIFAKPKARRSRYYIADNFLRSWLGALAAPASAMNFLPLAELVSAADERLMLLEGFALEKLVAHLYEERSRKGIGDFKVTSNISGFWDKGDTEIDLIALNEDERRIRLGSCKRSPEKLLSDLDNFRGHVARFLEEFERLAEWKIELLGVAPVLTPEQRELLSASGFVPQSLDDLIAPFRGKAQQPPIVG